MRKVVIPICCIAMAGCMVGPNYHRPATPRANHYTETRLPSKTANASSLQNAGKAQYFLNGRDIPAEWWRVFHCKELNALICAGLANNPSIHAAKASLLQAQENWRVAFGTLFFPSVDAQINGVRRRQTNSLGGTVNPALGSNIFTLYNSSINVSYTLDLFGGARRQLEKYSAEIDYQQFQLEAAKLTIATNIVTTAIAIASLDAQIQATENILHSQETQLEITKKQLKLGSVSGIDVLTQQTQVAQTRALLPPLKLSLVKSRDALSVLVGRVPSDGHLPKFSLNQFALPAQLPVSLPSALINQRPDIRAQEALVHAASAQIGIATANILPNITLTDSFGWNSNNLAKLFSPANVIWNYGAAILQPIFHGGATLAYRRATVAEFQQAAAYYRQTVLGAFQNVADSLEALKTDAIALDAERKAELTAKKTLTITEKQFKLGGTSYLSLLNAQQQYQRSSINRIQAQAARIADTASLYQALGGGWWNRDSKNVKKSVTVSYRRFSR